MLADALKALRRGDHAAAAEIARTLLLERPDDADAHHLLGLAERAAGQADAALASIERAIALAPDQALFHFSRASLMRDRRRPEEVRAELARAVQANPNQLAAYLILGQYALASGDAAEAERQFKLAQRVDAEHPHVLVAQAHLAAAQGRQAEVLGLLTRALTRAPEDPYVQSTLGLAYLSQGQDAFAEQLLGKALDKQPKAAGLRWARIEALRRQGHAEDTLREIDALLETDPVAAERGLSLRGDLLARLGRGEEAAADYARALESSPQPGRLLAVMLGVLLRHGQRQAARDLAESQLAREPLNDLFWQARLQIEAGQPAAQDEVLKRWAAARPDSPAALEAQALWAEAIGDLAQARELAARAQREDAPRAGAEFVLIRAALREDPAAALPRIERALNAAVDAAGRRLALTWHGLALDRLARPAEAVAAWHQRLAQPVPGLPLPVSSPAEPALPADEGPAPRLLWTPPGSRPQSLLRRVAALPCRLTQDRFSELPRADGLGPIRALDAAGQPAEPLPTWRRLLTVRGWDPATVVEWIPHWDERLASRLPGSRLLALLRDPRDLLLNLIAFGGPQPYQVPSIEIAAEWLAQVLAPLAERLARNDPMVLAVRGEALAAEPAAVASGIAGFFGLPAPEPEHLPAPAADPETGLGGVPLGFADGHWRDYAQVLAEPFARLAPIAQRLGYGDSMLST